MGTWADFRSTVASAVSAAMPASVRAPANNDGPTVTWTDDARPFGKHRLLLGIVSTVFNHDRDSALSTGGDQELSSMATITVQVQAESIHDRSSSPGDALWLLEQVRLGLRRVSVAEALRAAECPIVGFPLALSARSYKADSRIISAHSFDVQFRYVLVLTPDDETVGQIEHVEGEGEAPGDLVGIEFSVDDPTPDP